MGHNAAIRHFDPHPVGRTMSLFDEAVDRAPVIAEILSSPWLVRARDLLSSDAVAVTKRRNEPVEVVWDPGYRAPAAFRREDRTHRIDAVVATWAVERAWWDEDSRVSRRYWRVLSGTGTYDLAYDVVASAWVLLGVHD